MGRVNLPQRSSKAAEQPRMMAECPRRTRTSLGRHDGSVLAERKISAGRSLRSFSS